MNLVAYALMAILINYCGINIIGPYVLISGVYNNYTKMHLLIIMIIMTNMCFGIYAMLWLLFCLLFSYMIEHWNNFVTLYNTNYKNKPHKIENTINNCIFLYSCNKKKIIVASDAIINSKYGIECIKIVNIANDILINIMYVFNVNVIMLYNFTKKYNAINNMFVGASSCIDIGKTIYNAFVVKQQNNAQILNMTVEEKSKMLTNVVQCFEKMSLNFNDLDDELDDENVMTFDNLQKMLNIDMQSLKDKDINIKNKKI